MGKKKSKFAAVWLFPAIIAAVLLFSAMFSNLRADASEQTRAQLEKSLRRAAVACYAVQGRYPQSLAELRAHSGVQIDEAHYAVFYEVFAENLLPEITVVELK